MVLTSIFSDRCRDGVGVLQQDARHAGSERLNLLLVAPVDRVFAGAFLYSLT